LRTPRRPLSRFPHNRRRHHRFQGPHEVLLGALIALLAGDAARDLRECECAFYLGTQPASCAFELGPIHACNRAGRQLAPPDEWHGSHHHPAFSSCVRQGGRCRHRQAHADQHCDICPNCTIGAVESHSRSSASCHSARSRPRTRTLLTWDRRFAQRDHAGRVLARSVAFDLAAVALCTSMPSRATSSPSRPVRRAGRRKSDSGHRPSLDFAPPVLTMRVGGAFCRSKAYAHACARRENRTRDCEANRYPRPIPKHWQSTFDQQDDIAAACCAHPHSSCSSPSHRLSPPPSR
ncbi:hypothetical protein J2X65_000001, partial [Ancylobacter sp. 3268]|nr:hypothetical protein [Ancylobacter sp. 3268]